MHFLYMGSNQCKVIESIDIASFDDLAVREYLIDLAVLMIIPKALKIMKIIKLLEDLMVLYEQIERDRLIFGYLLGAC